MTSPHGTPSAVKRHQTNPDEWGPVKDCEPCRTYRLNAQRQSRANQRNQLNPDKDNQPMSHASEARRVIILTETAHHAVHQSATEGANRAWTATHARLKHTYGWHGNEASIEATRTSTFVRQQILRGWPETFDWIATANSQAIRPARTIEADDGLIAVYPDGSALQACGGWLVYPDEAATGRALASQQRIRSIKAKAAA